MQFLHGFLCKYIDMLCCILSVVGTECDPLGGSAVFRNVRATNVASTSLSLHTNLDSILVIATPTRTLLPSVRLLTLPNSQTPYSTSPQDGG